MLFLFYFEKLKFCVKTKKIIGFQNLKYQKKNKIKLSSEF